MNQTTPKTSKPPEPRRVKNSSPRQRVVFRAALCGDFTDVNLTKDDFLFGGKGNTIGHIAARNGHLDKMAHILTKEIVARPNSDGDTVAHIAARHGYFQQIPKECLSHELMLNSTNNRGITPQQRLDRFPEDRYKYHFDRIKHGIVDIQLLTTKDLIRSDGLGWTIAHAAIKAGLFAHIPSGLLTYEVMTQHYKDGVSVYDYAVNYGYSKFIPEQIHARLGTPRKKRTQDASQALSFLQENPPSTS